MLHLGAILLLLYRVKKARNCIGKFSWISRQGLGSEKAKLVARVSNHIHIGLSCKTQEMYLLVFCIRYMDLFMYFVSMYNTCMKIFFISSTAFIIYLMRFRKPYCLVSVLTALNRYIDLRSPRR